MMQIGQSCWNWKALNVDKGDSVLDMSSSPPTCMAGIEDCDRFMVQFENIFFMQTCHI